VRTIVTVNTASGKKDSYICNYKKELGRSGMSRMVLER
jgi:hypothetical protein